uniref:DNA mismatch repair protein MutS core domain-containing protein n=1 Tax=Globisporangium ultimum (strain ATCC 200006 / CBS 805.95 / DAOM BR144) TaxID=431595 RepID=K3WMC8_GLOUD
MPGCVIAVALTDDDVDDDDDNRGIAGVPPRPAHDEYAAVVCVVDVPALTISGYLLSAPPARTHKQQTAVLSSSIDDPSDSIKNSLKGYCGNSEATTIGAQLEALLQQSSGGTGLRSEIVKTVERAACVQPVVRIVDDFFGSDTEEHVEAQFGQLLAQPQALSVWKSEYLRQYRWFLLAANEILTHWQLYEETKLEGTFALEMHTEATEKHLRFNPAAQEVFTSSSPQTPSLVGMLSPFCHSRLAKERLRQWVKRPSVDPAVISERHSIVSALLAISSPGTAETSSVYPWLLRMLTHFASFEHTLKQFCGRKWMRASSTSKLPSLQGFERLLNWLTQLSALLALESASEYADDEKTILDKIVTPVKWLCDERLPPFCQMISESLHPIASTLNADADVNTQRIQTSARLHELSDQIQQCESEIERVKRQLQACIFLLNE